MNLGCDRGRRLYVVRMHNQETTVVNYDATKETENQINENERKSEQAHIPHAPTLLENAVYNEWQFQALVTGNLTKKGI